MKISKKLVPSKITTSKDPFACVQANTTAYAVYHSVHDNFYWMSNFGDPSFAHHVAVGLVWLKTAMLLVTNPLLPYDPRLYAEVVKSNFDDLSKLNSDLLKEQDITLCKLDIIICSYIPSTVW